MTNDNYVIDDNGTWNDPTQALTWYRKALATEKESADYAWRNTRTIEAARAEEMRKRDVAEAETAALRETIIALLEILRQWEPDHASAEDRRSILVAMYQVGILNDPAKTVAAMVMAEATHG
jgi:hypothetical protein